MIKEWMCLCDCGEVRAVPAGYLTRRSTTSCGCARREHAAAMGVATRTHGATTWHDGKKQATPEYTSWEGMKARCTNPNRQNFADYGGRGITVCDRWLHSFENFLADLGPRPAGKTLDRINNDLGYWPGNCKWSTRSEQQRNQRPRKLVTKKQAATETLLAVAA
jgi:hypothetical protein